MTQEASIVIRDLLYFDVEKAASIFSQLAGGLPEQTTEAREETSDSRNIRRYDLKVFAPEFGGVSSERREEIEVRVLHHDLLDRVETMLFDRGFAVDLNERLAGSAVSLESARREAMEYPYVRTTGLSLIEDFSRFRSFADEFKEVSKFLNQCARYTVEESEEMKELALQLDQAKAEAGRIKDRNEKAVAEQRVKVIADKVEASLKGVETIQDLPDWLMSGIGHFIDTFLRERINFRVLPFTSLPEFEVLGNLKRDSFVDSSLDNLLFAYGTKPHIELSVMGLVTAVPDRGSHPIDEVRQAQKSGASGSDEGAFEEGFRGVFESMHGFERFMRFSRYPRVTLHPIAVYRLLKGRPEK